MGKSDLSNKQVDLTGNRLWNMIIQRRNVVTFGWCLHNSAKQIKKDRDLTTWTDNISILSE